MRRFSLKNRKSSYSTSSKDGSSATNESTSNSSRLSLVDFDKRSSKSSFTSFSTRLKRSKSSKIEEEQAQAKCRREQLLTLGERFLDLPTEIQISILVSLSTEDLLSLRETSKQCLAIFQANAVTITRNILLSEPADESDNTCSTSFLVELYPSTFSSTTTDAYFLRTLRRMSLIKRQLSVLLTFIQTRVYMLKINTHLECQHFSPYRSRLYAHLYSSVGYTQHLFESIRHLVVHIHPTHPKPTSTIESCTSCTRVLQTVIACYPADSLVNIHQIMALLLQHLRAATRTPSSITIIERKFRGWSYGPPPEDHLSQLVILGGLNEVSKIDEMQGTYGKRVGVIKTFADTVAEATRINSIAFPDFYQTGYDPVMDAATPSSTNPFGTSSKDKTSQYSPRRSGLKQIQRDKYGDVRTALEAHADKLPVCKSLHPHLDLLTNATLQSLPHIETILVGQQSILVKRIKELQLIENIQDLSSPYSWIQETMEKTGFDDDGTIEEQFSRVL